jgi:hypothetical protein
MFDSKSNTEDFEAFTRSLINYLPAFSEAWPDDYMSFSVFARLNRVIYKVDICNSLFDSENWYIKLSPLSKEFLKFLIDNGRK